MRRNLASFAAIFISILSFSVPCQLFGPRGTKRASSPESGSSSSSSEEGYGKFKKRDIEEAKKYEEAQQSGDKIRKARKYLAELGEEDLLLGKRTGDALGERPLKFATGTSNQYTKTFLKHIDESFFKTTGAESKEKATKRNLGTLRLLALVWLGIIEKTKFAELTHDQKQKKADTYLKTFLPQSNKDLSVYVKEPKNCMKVVTRIKGEMGLG